MRWKSNILLGCFVFQAVTNLAFYGFVPIMFSSIVPSSAYRHIAWVLPFLILGYFALGTISLYYLGIATNFKRAKKFGAVYFLFGLLGSLWALLYFMRTPVETPILFAVLETWVLSSLVGLIIFLKGKEVSVPPALSVIAIALLSASAFLSAFSAQWLASDYYVHVKMEENVPKNATVIVAYPEQVPSPNITTSS
ncbi:MAG: hypothetical protein H0Z18_02175 [Thermococcus sp.]|uniref:hypothetical protein n=1 Tax=Thermococcus sp. TaxID=35749 RepID=UPI001DF16749|nr:hypothetical protein [Thermococcus sp.]MBO8174046.1 hypothetical protein [Thermococcus sp.]